MIFSLQFFEADEQHKHVEAELRSRLSTLEMEAAQHQAVVDGLTRKYMETIEKLQNDKAKLEVSSEIVWAFVNHLPALENRS